MPNKVTEPLRGVDVIGGIESDVKRAFSALELTEEMQLMWEAGGGERLD